jgi:TetR/AcrR family transcriptional repressor of mexJK operon
VFIDSSCFGGFSLSSGLGNGKLVASIHPLEIIAIPIVICIKLRDQDPPGDGGHSILDANGLPSSSNRYGGMMARVVRTSSGRPTPAQLEARTARVLKVAEELFVARGLSGTSVAEIARLAKVSPRLITAHFGDKADIFSAIIKSKNEIAFSSVTGGNAGDTLEKILFQAARFAWTTAYSPGAISFLRLVVSEGDRMAEMTSEIARKSSAHFFGEMESIFDSLMERGLIGRSDSQRLAKYFVDLMVGFALVQAGMGFWDRVPNDTELHDRVAFFCRAIERATESPGPAAELKLKVKGRTARAGS